jgi:hypothetical protein
MSEPPTPSGELETAGPSDGEKPRHQAWCDAEVPPGASTCPRCHVYQPQNTEAATHLAQSAQRAAKLVPTMRASRRKILRQIGATEATVHPVKSMLVDSLNQEFQIAKAYFEYLAKRPADADTGTLAVTSKGRVSRAATHHGASVDRIIRLAQLVGLEHATRPGHRGGPMEALARALEGDHGE